VHRRHGDALRADVPTRPDVVVVGAHGDDGAALDVEAQAAGRLAQRAGPEHGLWHAGDLAPAVALRQVHFAAHG
jgi:hypothetical protein